MHFILFYQACNILSFKIYFVHNIIGGGAKVLRGGVKISGEVQSHSRGGAHLPPKMRPWSMILFCVYMMYFDIKGVGVISVKQNKVFLVNGLTKISTLEINYNMNLH